MKLVSLLVFIFSLPAFSETFKISDVGAHPEAVHFDGKYFYASNLGVKANGDKDGDGYISVLGRDGSVIRKNILPSNVKLHTPTGMDHKDGYLFVVDMDRVVALPLYKRGLPFQIDLASSGATFLNDMVFVSDRHFVVTESKLQKLFLVDIKTKKFIELKIIIHLKMKKLMLDFQILFKKHWKVISVIVISVYLLYSYPDVKQGLMDGWIGR